MKKYASLKILLILVFGLGLLYFDLPTSVQSKINPFLNVEEASQSKNRVKLGLDLQGGSQLDYKIDLREVPESEQDDVVLGVLEVIEKRVNGLGINEPNIYTSNVGGETHIIVELVESGVVSQDDVAIYLKSDKPVSQLTEDERKTISLEKAKATVGKTIQLEFKEQKSASELESSDEEVTKIRETAENALNRILAGDSFQMVGQEEQQAKPGRIAYQSLDFFYKDELGSTGIQETIDDLEIGETHPEIVETVLDITQDESGQLVVNSGIQIYKLLEKKEEERFAKSVDVSHILISYQGAEQATASVTRTEDEAKELAEEILEQLKNGEKEFTAAAKEYSNDESNNEEGGKLTKPVTNSGTYRFNFEKAAMELNENGELSPVVKTDYGYHIIRADEIKTNIVEPKYKIEVITFSTTPDQWKTTALTGKHFKRAEVMIDQTSYRPVVQIQFDNEGGKLFEELTRNNINKQIAIFVGGQLVSAPVVNDVIPGGTATITGNFTQATAKDLAQYLNTGAIPAPIILTGEYTIGASLGQEALNQSLIAGAIGILIIMVFMLLYYRMAGLVANVALLIYTGIFIFLIKSSVPVYLAVAIAVLILITILSKISKNNESGADSIVSIVFSIIAFFLFTHLLTNNIVITLAGTAGIILSIGMAVDANILIFERFKEELRNGKSFEDAVNEGFARAWSAIRDSNFSTLIICGILYYFGTSIVRGFAFTLAAGILISMFTAITITRALLLGFVGRKIAEKQALFGVSKTKTKRKDFNFIGHGKTSVGISAFLILVSIILGLTLKLTPGIDFTGGSLMEVNFGQNVTREEIQANLLKTQEAINTNGVPVLETEETTEENAEITTTTPGNIDFSTTQILPSEENSYVIKTVYLDAATHQFVIDNLKSDYPELTETRFTSIGPTIGKALLKKALLAIVVSLAMMALYIRFAFRKLPKTVSTWKFGGSAIIALFQNIVITLGVFVVLSQLLNIEINALFITAMLTVLAYSINDTIVIFDKIRENLLEKPNGSLKEIANKAVNETLSRSLNTSLSTIAVLVAILIFGSPSIFYFVLAMAIGIAIGTYSSLFIAPTILVWWHSKKGRR